MSMRPFWLRNNAADRQTNNNVHSWPQLSTDIYSHFYCHLCLLVPLFLSHSSFRWMPVCDTPRSWRADCNLLSPCGWGVCVQVVNMPPSLFFFFSPSVAPFLASVSSFPAARMASNETEFDQVASLFLERSHLSHWPVMESASNAYINHTSFRTFSYA